MLFRSLTWRERVEGCQPADLFISASPSSHARLRLQDPRAIVNSLQGGRGMRSATSDAWALSFILATGPSVLGFAAPVSQLNEEPPQSSAPVAKQCGSIRLLVVNTPDVLLDALLPQFEKETGCAVTMTSTDSGATTPGTRNANPTKRQLWRMS